MAETITMVTMSNAALSVSREFPATAQAYWESRGWVLIGGPPAPVYDPVIDVYVGSLLSNPRSATGAAGQATFLPRWKATTDYAQGTFVLSPTGQIVQANTGFTSGATFNAANWTIVAGGGSVADATTTTKGIVELATSTETTTGTSSSLAVTPAGVKAVTDGLATVARTGSYTDLSNRPTIPPATTDAGALTSGLLDYGRMPSGSTITIIKIGSTWAARPTARTDIVVAWKGADPSPSIVASGTGGMLDGVDYRLVTP